MPDSMDRLLAIMARLRGPQGCPWDREQTLQTLRTFLLEESHEVGEAMRSGDPGALREELGDLLFQIVFQSRIAEEQGWFDFASVAEGIAGKLERRHPHVFGDTTLSTSSEVVRQWEELKDRERERNGLASRLAGVPDSLPALLRALRLSEKAARVGFDWKDARSVFEKVREEIGEWEESGAREDRDGSERELGDLLFSLVNTARKLGLDPEEALQRANDRFRDRFRRMERMLEGEGRRPEEVTPERLEELWGEAKRREREG
jgi:tetrapyrrole methylase family protein/MazG family protein